MEKTIRVYHPEELATKDLKGGDRVKPDRMFEILHYVQDDKERRGVEVFATVCHPEEFATKDLKGEDGVKPDRMFEILHYVQDDKERWGVEHFALVCHSDRAKRVE